MNSSLPRACYGLAVLAAALGLGRAHAADDASDPLEENPVPVNRFTINGRLGFNYKASFHNRTALPYPFPSSPGPATGGAVDRQYLNGYVKVDSSGNRDNLTWNFGYDSPAQIRHDTDQIGFNSVSGNLNVDSHDSAKTLPIGVELGYQRNFGKLGKLSWGIYGSFGWSDVEVKDDAVLEVPLELTTDLYSLGGVAVPLENSGGGYRGTFAGEGPLIGSVPSRSTTTIYARTQGTASSPGFRKIEASVLTFKLGPSLDIPVMRRLVVNLSAGLAAAFVDGEFSYNEDILLSDFSGGTISLLGGGRSARATKSELELGGYAQARIGLRGTGLFIGAEYQYLPDYKVSAGIKDAQLDMGQSFFIEAGIGFGF